MGIREGLIPITVSIASGNNGGPLVNSFGQVMGTKTFKIRGADGFNFARSASLLCESLVACNDPIWKY
jgi:S1-C subfamily serine protease